MTVVDPSRRELARIIHGTDDPALHDRLLAALTGQPTAAHRAHDATDADAGARTRRMAHLLGRVADCMPPAREMFERPDRLITAHVWAAVSEPSLFMSMVTHYMLCLNSVLSLSGDPAELREEIHDLRTGRVKGAYMITEVGAASSHIGTRTTARFDPATREFTLDTAEAGAAKFVAAMDARVPQVAAVLARLLVGEADCGVFAFLVDLCDARGALPGVSFSPVGELGALPLDYSLVTFRAVRLPFARWLRDSASIDRDGVFHDPLGSADGRLQRTLSVGQALWATVPAAVAATARQSVVLALRQSARRLSLGRIAPGSPVLAYQPQRRALLTALAEAFAVTCTANRARELWTEAAAASTGGAGDSDTLRLSPWASVSRPLAALKAFAVAAASRLIGECQVRCGVHGYLDANRLAGYAGFTTAFVTAGGSNALITMDIGCALAEEFVHAPAQPEAPQPVGTARWWLRLAHAQEQLLAAELRGTLDQQPAHESFLRWNPLLDEACELGEAHATRLAASSVVETLATVADGELLAVLRLLAGLFAVAEARRNAATLMRTALLAPEVARSLPGIQDDLCDQLIPYLPLLQDVMGFPDELVRSPMGAADYPAALAAGASAWQ
jgi:acyl-CoA oxidase